MVRELSPKLAKIAKEELNENSKEVSKDLEYLKEWLSKQPHLKARTEEQWLLAILRGCKFSLERAKNKIDLYYTLRTTAPDVTLRNKPSEQKFIDFLKLGSCLVLPKAQEEVTPRVILIRGSAYDPAKHSVADVICTLYYLVQIMVYEDDVATIVGTKIIVDYEGIGLSHITQLTPTLLKKIVTVIQDSFPLRLKGSHHVNFPSALEMVSKLLNEKTRKRFIVHKSHSELLDHFPKEIIPAEYGGDGGTTAELAEHWANKMKEYKSWMQLEDTLGTDETKRPGKPKTSDEMFGVEGSFKKLEID